MKKFRNILSFDILAVIVCVFFVANYAHVVKPYNKTHGVIGSDVKAYYGYLPAKFIFDDMHLNYLSNPEYKPYVGSRVWTGFTEDKKPIFKVSYGMSFFYSPFFAIAHYYASHSDKYDAYGYSKPYRKAVQFASIFYFIVSIILLRKILRRYFGAIVTGISLVVIVFATNLYYYSTSEAAMSHLYSFFLINLFIFLLLRWLDKQSFLNAVFIGLTVGFITLVRPTNAIISLLFLFLGVHSKDAFVSRIHLLLKNWKSILLMIVLAVVVWIPQSLYWHEITGKYIYFSYGYDAHFFWTDPQIMNVLFSYRKGWLLYTPVMLIAIAGIFFVKPKYKVGKLAIGIPLLLYIYVFSCWCFWWFGGSYGSRAFIDLYGLLAIPMAAFIDHFFTQKKLWSKIAVSLLMFVFVAHGVFQNYQYRYGAIHYVSMTKEAYWDSFGRLKPSKDFSKYLEYPDYDGVRKRIKEAKGIIDKHEDKK